MRFQETGVSPHTAACMCVRGAGRSRQAVVQAKGTGREQAVQGQSQAVDTLNLLSRLSKEQEVTNSHERSQQTGDAQLTPSHLLILISHDGGHSP